MSYLLTWVNSEGRLSQPATSLEKDFASGLRFVELLQSAGVMGSDALPGLQNAHPLEVYEAVTAAMDGIQAEYKPSVVGKAVSGARGGAPAMLLAIKQALERRAKGAKAGVSAPAAPGSSVAAAATVRPSKTGQPFVKPESDPWGADDFLDHTIATNPKAFRALPGQAPPFAAVDMAVHLRRFHDEQRQLERRQAENEASEAGAALQARDASYARSNEEARQRAAFVRGHLEEGEAQWRTNQRAKLERERSQLRFELSLQQRRQVKADITRFTLTNEVQADATDFERNMKRLGIEDNAAGGGGGASTQGGGLMSTASETGLAYLRRIEHLEKQHAMTPEEGAEMLQSVRTRAASNRQARLERERRRRKMVYDQKGAQVEAQHQCSQDAEFEALLHQGRRARSAAKRQWEASALKAIQLSARELATQALQSSAALECAKVLESLTLEAREAYDAKRPERYAAANERAVEAFKKQEARLKRTVHLVEDVVEGLVVLALATVQQRRDLGRPLVLSDWLALRRGFVQDTLRPPPPPPLPRLGPEEEACLGLDQNALQVGLGGYRTHPLPITVAANGKVVSEGEGEEGENGKAGNNKNRRRSGRRQRRRRRQQLPSGLDLFPDKIPECHSAVSRLMTAIKCADPSLILSPRPPDHLLFQLQPAAVAASPQPYPFTSNSAVVAAAKEAAAAAGIAGGPSHSSSLSSPFSAFLESGGGSSGGGNRLVRVCVVADPRLSALAAAAVARNEVKALVAKPDNDDDDIENEGDAVSAADKQDKQEVAGAMAFGLGSVAGAPSLLALSATASSAAAGLGLAYSDPTAAVEACVAEAVAHHGHQQHAAAHAAILAAASAASGGGNGSGTGALFGSAGGDPQKRDSTSSDLSASGALVAANSTSASALSPGAGHHSSGVEVRYPDLVAVGTKLRELQAAAKEKAVRAARGEKTLNLSAGKAAVPAATDGGGGGGDEFTTEETELHEICALDSIVYPDALVALAVVAHLASQRGNVGPRKLLTTNHPAVSLAADRVEVLCAKAACSLKESAENAGGGEGGADGHAGGASEEKDAATVEKADKEEEEEEEEAGELGATVEEGKQGKGEAGKGPGKKPEPRPNASTQPPPLNPTTEGVSGLKGWVVANFPFTVTQARLMEYALARSGKVAGLKGQPQQQQQQQQSSALSAGEGGEGNGGDDDGGVGSAGDSDLEELLATALTLSADKESEGDNEGAAAAAGKGKGKPAAAASAGKGGKVAVMAAVGLLKNGGIGGGDDGGELAVLRDVLKWPLPHVDALLWVAGSCQEVDSPPVDPSADLFVPVAKVSNAVVTAAATLRGKQVHHRSMRQLSTAEPPAEPGSGGSAAAAAATAAAKKALLPETQAAGGGKGGGKEKGESAAAEKGGAGRKSAGSSKKDGKKGAAAAAEEVEVVALTPEERRAAALEEASRLAEEQAKQDANALVRKFAEAKALKKWWQHFDGGSGESESGEDAQGVDGVLAAEQGEPSSSALSVPWSVFSCEVSLLPPSGTAAFASAQELAKQRQQSQQEDRRGSGGSSSGVFGGLAVSAAGAASSGGGGALSLALVHTQKRGNSGALRTNKSKSKSPTTSASLFPAFEASERNNSVEHIASPPSLSSPTKQQKSVPAFLPESELCTVSRFAFAVETIEIAVEKAAQRRSKWELEAHHRVVAMRVAALSHKKACLAAVGTLQEGGEVPTPPLLLTDPRKALYEMSYSSGGGDEEEKNAEGGGANSQKEKTLPKPQPQLLLTEVSVASARRARRLNLSSPAEVLWLAVRCGEHSSVLTAKHVRRPLKAWVGAQAKHRDGQVRACLEMVRQEQSVARLKGQIRWATACAVRSSDGDVTAHLLAKASQRCRSSRVAMSDSAASGGGAFGDSLDNSRNNNGGGFGGAPADIVLADVGAGGGVGGGHRLRRVSTNSAGGNSYGAGGIPTLRTATPSSGAGNHNNSGAGFGGGGGARKVAAVEARMAIVDDLELELGDVATRRYTASLKGLGKLRKEANQEWTRRVELNALGAAAAIASNEVRRISAAESLLNEYFDESNIGGGAFPSAACAAATVGHPTDAGAMGSANLHAFHSEAAATLRAELTLHGFVTKNKTGHGLQGKTPPPPPLDDKESTAFEELAAVAALTAALDQLAPSPASLSSPSPPLSSSPSSSPPVPMQLTDGRDNGKVGVSEEGGEDDHGQDDFSCLAGVLAAMESDAVRAKHVAAEQKREIVAVLKVRALETIRGAVARAARLRSTAVQAAAEATAATTATPSNGNGVGGGAGGGLSECGGGGGLSAVVARRTQAEQKVVAATAKRLRIQVGAEGGGDALVSTLDRLASDGGILRGLGDGDGVDVADPSEWMDLGVSTLDLTQARALVRLLCDADRKNKQAQRAAAAAAAETVSSVKPSRTQAQRASVSSSSLLFSAAGSGVSAVTAVAAANAQQAVAAQQKEKEAKEGLEQRAQQSKVAAAGTSEVQPQKPSLDEQLEEKQAPTKPPKRTPLVSGEGRMPLTVFSVVLLSFVALAKPPPLTTATGTVAANAAAAAAAAAATVTEDDAAAAAGYTGGGCGGGGRRSSRGDSPSNGTARRLSGGAAASSSAFPRRFSGGSRRAGSVLGGGLSFDHSLLVPLAPLPWVWAHSALPHKLRQLFFAPPWRPPPPPGLPPPPFPLSNARTLALVGDSAPSHPTPFSLLQAGESTVLLDASGEGDEENNDSDEDDDDDDGDAEGGDGNKSGGGEDQGEEMPWQAFCHHLLSSLLPSPLLSCEGLVEMATHLKGRAVELSAPSAASGGGGGGGGRTKSGGGGAGSGSGGGDVGGVSSPSSSLPSCDRVFVSRADALASKFPFDDHSAGQGGGFSALAVAAGGGSDHFQDGGGAGGAPSTSKRRRESAVVASSGLAGGFGSEGLGNGLRELYVSMFQLDTGVRLVAADAMLLHLACAPAPPLASGFSDGLFRAANVAAAFHPFVPSSRTTTNLPGGSSSGGDGGAALKRATGSMFADVVVKAKGEMKGAGVEEDTRHLLGGSHQQPQGGGGRGPAATTNKTTNVGSGSSGGGGGGQAASGAGSRPVLVGMGDGPTDPGPLLSHKALELLLAVAPPPPRRSRRSRSSSKAPPSAATLLATTRNRRRSDGDDDQEEGGSGVRACISFAEFAALPEVMRWSEGGWFRLRDLGGALSALRAAGKQ